MYGETKRAGETAVMDSGCRHVLLRTSWVYSSHGHNFVLSMLRLAAARDRLRIVDDQRGCPTWARNLARASRLMIDRALLKSSDDITGLYHYCDRDVVSWHGFAAAILGIAADLGLLERFPELEAITSEDFPQKARRPAYSVLDAGRAAETFGIEQPGLVDSLQACLGELAGARR